MTTLHVDRFLGIAPKLGHELLAQNQAQIAEDAKLWSEKLRAIGGLGAPETLSKAGTIQTIYRYDDQWLHWNEDVNVARGPIANDELEKIYFTGTDVPRVTTLELYDDVGPGTSIPPASYILGIPAPEDPPVATDTGAGNITGDVDWVFTFARHWSDGTVDEGPPSAPSNILSLVSKKADVTLPNGTIVAADYGITHKRLYRLNGTARFLVVEVVIGTASTEDNVAAADLGVAIESTEWVGPPDDMIGLIELPNGILAGFSGKTVCLSEPYRPWAWPAVNRYTVNWPIVAIGSVGTSIVAATTSHTYIGRGVDPAAYSFKRDPGRFPCVSKRSMASSDLGALWATTNGVAACDGVGVILATKAFLTRGEWQRDFAPTTLHALVHDGRYFAWFHNGTDEVGTFTGGGLILDWSERAFLTTLSQYQYAAYSVPDEDALHVSRKLDGVNNVVALWDSDPSVPFTYQWRSKVFITQGLENFGWCQIFGDYASGLSQAEIDALLAAIAAAIAYNQAIVGPLGGELNGECMILDNVAINGDCRLMPVPSLDFISGSILFKYWADGILKLERYVWSNEPFPLPSGFRAEKHFFEVNGAVETTQVTLATSVEELASV